MVVSGGPNATDGTDAPRSITVLGSTGSVGRNTVELIDADRSAFVVEALTANRDVDGLAEQARRLKPRLAVVADPSRYQELRGALAGTDIEVAAGAEAVIEAAARPTDWLMAAIVGAAGLAPTLEAVRRGSIVALANKESLVSAGDVMVAEVRHHKATLIPVDSEHNAIYQVFDFEHAANIERIILTASGGPFRERQLASMADVTPEEAVAHPNWDMGAKISVDSATMMNKGLELIEAFHLFPVGKERIEILVHPQSVVHSMVAYSDGSVLAQMSEPDMRTPIAYALGWPKRMASPAPRLDLAKIGTLTFEAPDPRRFPALQLARDALQTGGAAPTILNAANEIAVHGFLAREIGFLDIARIVEQTVATAPNGQIESLDDVFEADEAARRVAGQLMSRHRAAG
ncbi:MAG: 1-deoxy-D-xylulose-5-phosphate reductoisomerase [Rhodospirillales bacterium]|nr:1-deoxy-D-xylulose-5-phosphate reductoisomerase [Rhodospirillales bacterium]